MKIPESPPDFNETISQWSPEALRENLGRIAGGRIGAVDEKGRYLHWDKLRHLQPPQGYTPALYWLAIQFARQGISRKLAYLKDKKGEPFAFCMPETVMRDILWITENASGAVQGDARISNPQLKQAYLINSLMEEAINSSQLEGASTSRRVAKELIRTGRQPQNHSEKMIVNNYRAMMLIKDLKDEQLTPSIVFELHKTVTDGTLSEEDGEIAGAFRTAKDDICVFSKDDDRTLVYVPPAASELPDRLQALCDFANKKDETDRDYIPPIIRAIIVHFMIGYDHPFVDGNGRTARALFYWMMAKEKYWLMEYISISRVIKKAPAKYMQAYLYSETDNNDLTYFIVHQLDVIKEAIRDLHEYLAAKANQQREVEDALHHSALNKSLNFRQMSLMRNALKNPGAEYTIKSHQTSHGVSYQTARTDLLALSELHGLLRKYKSGKADVFIAPADLTEIIRNYDA